MPVSALVLLLLLLSSLPASLSFSCLMVTNYYYYCCQSQLHQVHLVSFAEMTMMWLTMLLSGLLA